MNPVLRSRLRAVLAHAFAVLAAVGLVFAPLSPFVACSPVESDSSAAPASPADAAPAAPGELVERSAAALVPPPPADCGACLSELPPAACPEVDAVALEYRCAREIPPLCTFFAPATTHLRIVRAGCWSVACAGVPAPWAIYIGSSPCALGSTEPEVHLFCW